MAGAVICVALSGYGSPIAVAFNGTLPPADNATATGQAPGSAKILSGVLTLVADAPTGNGVPQSQRAVTLMWKASTSAGVKYNVYRSAKKGECLKIKSNDCKRISPSPVSGTRYKDDMVQAGHSYFYVTRSVSSGGTKSGPSNEVSVVISLAKP